MTPYYDHAGVTIYHGDCRAILWDEIRPDSIDLLLADPPYGVGFEMKARIVGRSYRRASSGGKPAIHGDDEPFDPSHLLGFRRCVLFGANHYSDKLPVSGGWLVWDKTGGGRGPDNSFADVEMAWSNIVKTPRIFHHLWKGLARDTEAGERVVHPTQKPVALMAWIINDWTKRGDTILDPYTGSGTALVAAKALGRRAIGIEIEERYCEIAAKRLAQELLFPIEEVSAANAAQPPEEASKELK